MAYDPLMDPPGMDPSQLKNVAPDQFARLMNTLPEQAQFMLYRQSPLEQRKIWDQQRFNPQGNLGEDQVNQARGQWINPLEQRVRGPGYAYGSRDFNFYDGSTQLQNAQLPDLTPYLSQPQAQTDPATAAVNSVGMAPPPPAGAAAAMPTPIAPKPGMVPGASAGGSAGMVGTVPPAAPPPGMAPPPASVPPASGVASRVPTPTVGMQPPQVGDPPQAQPPTNAGIGQGMGGGLMQPGGPGTRLPGGPGSNPVRSALASTLMTRGRAPLQVR